MRISKILQRQLSLNERKNLLHPDVMRMLEVEPAFLAALEEAIASSEREAIQIDRLATETAQAFVDKILSINQFLQISQEAMDSLRNIYFQTWRKMTDTGDVETVLRSYHFPQLSDWTRRIYPESLRAALASRSKIGSVICQDYSATLQMELLKLSFPMKEPVLDLGCGKSAQLVTSLRRAGVEACGLDRFVNKRKPYLKQASWLETTLEPDRWGTVISHMAFTNHFLCVEKFDTGQVSRYKEKYQEILSSLRPGGLFVYAPSCNTLESTVDRIKYNIERRSLWNGYESTKVLRNAS